jgi:apolipoprotein N-acyltransferase
MNIFGIIGICFFIVFVIFLIYALVFGAEFEVESNLFWIISIICALLVWVGAVFIGIGINTQEEKVYVQKYLAQKQTIEMSLENEELTGLERIELVKQATELNGELAERKARVQSWYVVVYDNTIYDNVELIKLTKGE